MAAGFERLLLKKPPKGSFVSAIQQERLKYLEKKRSKGGGGNVQSSANRIDLKSLNTTNNHTFMAIQDVKDNI